MSGIQIDEKHGTGLAVISVDDKADNSIIVVSGGQTWLWMKAMPNACTNELEKAKVVMLQLEVPLEASLSVARSGKKNGVYWSSGIQHRRLSYRRKPISSPIT